MTARHRRHLAARASFWAGKSAAAGTPAGRMSVAFDEVRSRISDLPEAERDAARRELTALLRNWRR